MLCNPVVYMRMVRYDTMVDSNGKQKQLLIREAFDPIDTSECVRWPDNTKRKSGDGGGGSGCEMTEQCVKTKREGK